MYIYTYILENMYIYINKNKKCIYIYIILQYVCTFKKYTNIYIYIYIYIYIKMYTYMRIYINIYKVICIQIIYP